VTETIFALSSGSPPAGIAVVRISGPGAKVALDRLTRMTASKPRFARLARLVDDRGLTLDQALTLWFPGPHTATGEDIAELHLHGGRAVVAAVLNALSRFPDFRIAEPGEFTRRAFENGKIDLAEAEGLADLLSAETEMQRRSAIAQLGGALHRMTEVWVHELLKLSALVEAQIDFSDEDDVSPTVTSALDDRVSQIINAIRSVLANPPAERLHRGLRIAILGPPNSGKSTLLNRLVSREAAIVSNIPGTTRDAIEAHVVLRGLSLVFIDTAGLRDVVDDPIEQMGIERSLSESKTADIILALGGWSGPAIKALTIEVAAKSDLSEVSTGLQVSAHTGQGIEDLIDAVVRAAHSILPTVDQVALHERHRIALLATVAALDLILFERDELIVAEQLRIALAHLASVTGGGDTEGMLDLLFGSFCIGK
jgi:tRNA modification GTPase